MSRQDDERAIEDLFERLDNVERNSGPRDPDAEALIQERLRRNPAAAYYMAQTIIVQEAALRDQQQRLEALEQREDDGGFLGGIFGNDRPRRQQPRPIPQQQPPRRGPWGQAEGGGFLAGAAQTALGVTGGLLLGSAIVGMFGGGAVEAAEADPDAGSDDLGGEGDIGGDDWGGGGFDVGGDF